MFRFPSRYCGLVRSVQRRVLSDEVLAWTEIPGEGGGGGGDYNATLSLSE